MEPLIPSLVTVGQLPAADRIYYGHPSVLALPGGRILLTVDHLGPDVRNLTGQKGRFSDTNHWLQGRLYASADEGQTWTAKQEYPFSHACLFRDGQQLYILGHRGSLVIMKSSDGGETWSKPADLAPKGGETGLYAHSPCSVLHANGNFYVPLLRAPLDPQRRTTPHTLAPVLMVAAEGTNLTSSKNWEWSEQAPPFEKLAPWESLGGLGLPYFDIAPAKPGTDRNPRPWPLRPGWTHPHAVSIDNPHHGWHDPAGRTVHVLTAADVHRANLAALTKVVKHADGLWRTDLETTPSGQRQALLPLPGGNQKFHIQADRESKQYWLLSSQFRDSMARPAPAPGGRMALPSERPQLLQLSFSSNLVDWIQAGWVAGTPADPLTHPAMDFRGRDLCVAALARDTADPTNRHAKRLCFGMVRNFRSLLYGAG